MLHNKGVGVWDTRGRLRERCRSAGTKQERADSVAEESGGKGLVNTSSCASSTPPLYGQHPLLAPQLFTMRSRLCRNGAAYSRTFPQLHFIIFYHIICNYISMSLSRFTFLQPKLGNRWHVLINSALQSANWQSANVLRTPLPDLASLWFSR